MLKSINSYTLAVLQFSKRLPVVVDLQVHDSNGLIILSIEQVNLIKCSVLSMTLMYLATFTKHFANTSVLMLGKHDIQEERACKMKWYLL